MSKKTQALKKKAFIVIVSEKREGIHEVIVYNPLNILNKEYFGNSIYKIFCERNKKFSARTIYTSSTVSEATHEILSLMEESIAVAEHEKDVASKIFIKNRKKLFKAIKSIK